MFEYTKGNIIHAIKNVGMYVRLSREKNDGADDLERHRTAMIEMCEKYKWNYVLYEEIGSGESIEGRVKIKELLEDIEEGLYDAVLVYDFDRLGRGSGGDQDRIARTLKDSDTLVVTVNPFEVLDTNDERDEETIEFKGFLARREYKMIRKRLEAGKKISQKMGRWSTGYAPFGYQIHPQLKKLVIDEENSKIFRDLMVEPYLSGYSSVDISNELNKRNILTTRKSKWTPRMVLYALQNKTYLGNIYYNRRYTDRLRKGQEKPESEWSVSENTHPPLMTEDEYNQIISMIKSKKSSGEKGGNALSTMIKCYNCGASLRIKKEEGKRMAIKGCINCNQNRGGSMDLINDAIKDALSLLREKLIHGENGFDNEAELQAAEQDVKRIEREISKINTAIEKVEEAFEMGMYSADKAKERINKRQKELLVLNKTLKEANKKYRSIKKTDNKSMVSKIDEFFEEIEKTADGKKLRVVYRKVIDSIIWERNQWDEVKVTVNYK